MHTYFTLHVLNNTHILHTIVMYTLITLRGPRTTPTCTDAQCPRHHLSGRGLIGKTARDTLPTRPHVCTQPPAWAGVPTHVCGNLYLPTHNANVPGTSPSPCLALVDYATTHMLHTTPTRICNHVHPRNLYPTSLMGHSDIPMYQVPTLPHQPLYSTYTSAISITV